MSILAYLLMQLTLGTHGIHDLKGFTVDSGRLSVYHPNDGSNSGGLSCGGKLTWADNHIAYRRWWKVGCRRRVLVCTAATKRCAWSKVMDGGPYGVYRGSMKNCVKEGRYRVASREERRRGKPKVGWKWRSGPGGPDLSHALWKRLGRPPFLSAVTLYFPPRGWIRGSRAKVAQSF